ncbi:MmgE/PrpD family protein [Parapusillimonas sp. JC17]|uniref:MmgE/PrpD family protein n=1 Tax=Parapusillimonas sp. JC17 TaxID=3445768 RepID=UPI003F9FAB29
MATLAQQMARFIASDISPDIDPELHNTILVAFLDTVGCVLSGRAEPVTRQLNTWLEQRFKNDSAAHLLFSDERHSVAAAAMLNAVSGHALDLDDVALAGHPSVVLVPALLAEADHTGVRGAALVSAYIKGYQVWADLLQRLPDPLHVKGWHPTAVLGTLGVAAAMCAARNISPAVTAHALGLAASRASGLVANFGSMAKPLHAGWAVEQGISAVELAQSGMTASMDALDGPTGLLTALSSTQAPDRETPFLDSNELAMRSVRPSVKKYPVCYASHRVIDGVIQLRNRHGLRAEDIDRIEAQVSITNARVLKYDRPTSALEAKFSMPFACACALEFGEVDLQRLSADTLRDSNVQALMPKVHVRELDTQCPIEPSFAYTDRVLVTLKDQTVLDSGPIRYAIGHAKLPLLPDQIEAKVLGCVDVAEQADTRLLIGRIRGLLSA